MSIANTSHHLRHTLSADGTRIGYTIDGRGRDTLLLHGLQRTGAVWEDILSGIGAGRRIVRPDLRGRGHSAVPTDLLSYTIERLADDLEAVVADACAGPLDLVAWSMGCSVAWAYARRPGARRVRRWVFVSGSPSPLGTRGWFAADDLAGAQAEARERALRKGMTDTADPYAAAAAWMSVREVDFLAEPPPLSGVPKLFIHGDADPECPIAPAMALADSMPNSERAVLAGVGHNPMQESPERVCALIDDFLR